MANNAATIAFGVIFACLALIFTALCFGTGDIIIFRVDRKAIVASTDTAVVRDRDTKTWYFDRRIGFFRTCFPEPEKGMWRNT